MRKLIYILLILILVMPDAMAQDPQVSQFYASPTLLAPSMAGTTNGSRAGINFRDQWPAIPGAFVTYTLTFDHYFPGMKSGVGLLFLKDRAGTGKLSTTNVGLQYSYRIPVSRTLEIRPGLQVYYSQRNADFYAHTFGDQLSFNGIAPVTSEQSQFEKTGYMDFATSLFVFTADYWGGIMIDHLVKPNESLLGGVSEIPMKFKVFGGAKIFLNNTRDKYNEETVSPTFLYKSQGKYDQFDIGAYWTRQFFVLGFWYRGIPGFKAYKKGYGNSDAISILVGYKWEDLKIGYSYDFTISKLINHTSGSHEITTIFEFNQNQRIRKRKNKIVVPCPKF